MNSINIYILLLLSQGVFSVDPSSLRLISVVFRHGDRSPISTYPNDPTQEKDWPQGFGQLTERGIQRAFELGHYFRTEYEGFLSPDYRRKEMYVRATDYDRALMTAQAVLNGLYPPAGEQEWRSQLAWQPIPVHSEEMGADVLFGLATCTKVSQQPLEKNHTEKLHQLIQEFRPLVDIVEENTGYSVNESSTNFDLEALVQNITYMHDIIYIEKDTNHSLPAWMTDDVQEWIAQFDQKKRELFPYTYDYWKYSGGPMLGEMVRHMEQKANGSLHDRKAYLYSGHDSTIKQLLSVLNISMGERITYTTSLLVELHELEPQDVEEEGKDHLAEEMTEEGEEGEAEEEEKETEEGEDKDHIVEKETEEKKEGKETEEKGEEEGEEEDKDHTAEKETEEEKEEEEKEGEGEEDKDHISEKETEEEKEEDKYHSRPVKEADMDKEEGKSRRARDVEKKGRFIVRLFLRDGVTEERRQLKLEDCPDDCPLERFVTLTKYAIPNDWTKECNIGVLSVFDLGELSNTIVVASVLGVSIFVLLLILVCCCIQARRRPGARRYATLGDTDFSEGEEEEEGVPMRARNHRGNVREYHDDFDDEDSEELKSVARG